MAEIIACISGLVAIIGAIIGVIRYFIKKRRKENIYVTDNPLRCIWDCLDVNLQNAFAIIYNSKHKKREPITIRTSDLFKVMIMSNDKSLNKFLESIPKKALPLQDTIDYVNTKENIVNNKCNYSNCVLDSINGFKNKNLKRKIKPLDMFLDIAINGNGSSVKKLRENNIGPDELRQRIIEGKFDVITRNIDNEK